MLGPRAEVLGNHGKLFLIYPKCLRRYQLENMAYWHRLPFPEGRYLLLMVRLNLKTGFKHNFHLKFCNTWTHLRKNTYKENCKGVGSYRLSSSANVPTGWFFLYRPPSVAWAFLSRLRQWVKIHITTESGYFRCGDGEMRLEYWRSSSFNSVHAFFRAIGKWQEISFNPPERLFPQGSH